MRIGNPQDAHRDLLSAVLTGSPLRDRLLASAISKDASFVGMLREALLVVSTP